VILGAVLPLLAGCEDAPAATPVPAAVKSVRAAASSMQAATSFHFAGNFVAGTQTVTLSGVYSQPGRLDETVQLAGRTFEFLLDGNTAYERFAPGTRWEKVTRSSAGALTDPRHAFALLAAVDDANGSGGKFTFTLSGDAAASLVAGSSALSGTVTVVSGKIVDLTYTSASPAVNVHITYSAVGTTATVTPPPAKDVISGTPLPSPASPSP